MWGNAYCVGKEWNFVCKQHRERNAMSTERCEMFLNVCSDYVMLLCCFIFGQNSYCIVWCWGRCNLFHCLPFEINNEGYSNQQWGRITSAPRLEHLMKVPVARRPQLQRVRKVTLQRLPQARKNGRHPNEYRVLWVMGCSGYVCSYQETAILVHPCFTSIWKNISPSRYYYLSLHLAFHTLE